MTRYIEKETVDRFIEAVEYIAEQGGLVGDRDGYSEKDSRVAGLKSLKDRLHEAEERVKGLEKHIETTGKILGRNEDEIEELDRLNGNLNWDLHEMTKRAEKAEARVEELETELAAYQERYAELDNLRDQGHVAVMLPREYVEWLTSGEAPYWIRHHRPSMAVLFNACRKALEADRG